MAMAVGNKEFFNLNFYLFLLLLNLLFVLLNYFKFLVVIKDEGKRFELFHNFVNTLVV